MLDGIIKSKGPEVIKSTLAKRIGQLMLPVDWCWIIGFGVICPVFYLVILECYRPLVALNSDNYVSNLLILPWFYLMTLFATFTSILSIVARWRLAKRMKMFGFTRCSSRVITLIILWNLVQLPLLGLMPSGITDLYVFCGVGFIITMGAIATLNAALIDRRKNLLERSTLGQFLDLTSALVAILMLCLIPVFKAAQQNAFEQDQLIRLDPAYPAASPYENRVARQIQKETQDILGD